MFNLIDFDNGFFRFLSKLIDCFYLSILWAVFSIPIVTIGASSTALYDTAFRVIRRGEGYLWKTFWGSFKENFKKSTKMWLIMLVILAVLIADCAVTRDYLIQGSKIGVFYYLFLMMVALVYVWAVFCFGYVARFDLEVKPILKNGAILMLAKLPWSLLIILMLAVVITILQFAPVFAFLFPSGVALTHSYILERIFRQFMKPEDLERVLENEREDY